MVDLFDEIKEDVTREKYAKLWLEYGKYVIATAIAIVIITTLAVAYKGYKAKQYEKLGNMLYQSFKSESEGNIDNSIKGYSELADLDESTYSQLSSMRNARILSGQNKQDEANKLYQEIFNSDKSVKELKDLAAILYLQNSLESKADDQILQAVNDIINDNNIYKYTAKQLLAYYNYNIGNSSEAKRLFEELLQSTDTPANIKKRSNEMLNAINSKITQ